MTRALSNLGVFAAVAALSACGKPLETKEEFTHAAAGAAVPTTAANTSGALMRLYMSGAETPEQLPVPSLTVKGSHGGEATLSVNPVGIVVGLAGRGIMFDLEYDDYSVDGLNYLWGKVSVLADFDYIAAAQEDPNANFQISFVGTLGMSGLVRDEARLNVKVKTNLADLMTHEGTTKLRLHGTVTASEVEFDFQEEEFVIDWKALEEQAQKR